MVEYPPMLWNPGRKKRIIHADFLPAEIDSNYHPEVELIGDLAHALWMLNERVGRDGVKLVFDFERQRELRREMWEDIAEHADDDTVGTIRPQKALWDVRQVLGPNDILLSDVGARVLSSCRSATGRTRC